VLSQSWQPLGGSRTGLLSLASLVLFLGGAALLFRSRRTPTTPCT
jgi:LPXTG-motif cell wall-anchored protein